MEKQAVVDIRKDTYEFYIGRGPKGRRTKWGNPFVVGRDGERGECVKKYAEWILRGNGTHLLKDLAELEGKTLGCFCAPPGGATADAPKPYVCHGQVLLNLIEQRQQIIERKRSQ